MYKLYSYLLQLPSKDTIEKLSANERTYLISGIVFLFSCLVACVLYIRTLHNKMIDREKENNAKMLEREKATIEILVDATKDFAASNVQVKASIDAHTKSSDNMTASANNLAGVVNDMHSTILQMAALGGLKGVGGK